jgi:outer membrane protein
VLLAVPEVVLQMIAMVLFFLGGGLTAKTAPKLSLSDCVNLTFQKSPYYRQIQSTIYRSSTDVFAAVTPILPQIFFSSGYIRSGPGSQAGVIVEPTLPVSSVQAVGSQNTYQTAITLDQSLFNPSSWLSIKQAAYSSNVTHQSSKASVADLIFNVKQAFYSLLQSYNSHSVANATLAQNKEQVEIARQRYSLGAINRPDLLQLETAFIQGQTNLLESDAQITSAYQKLASLIGNNESFTIDTTLAFPDTTEAMIPFDSLLVALDDYNPTIKAAKLTVLVDKTNNKRLWWSTVPTISFGLTYGYSNSTFGFSNWSDHYFYNVEFNFTWNAFGGGSTLAQIRQNTALISSSEASEQIARSTAIEQLHRAYNNFLTANQELSIIDPLTRQSNESYTLMLEKFRLGAASSNDLLSSQLTLIQSSQKATSILINYYSAQAEIKRIFGKW